MKPILEVHNLSKEFLIVANNEPYLALRDILSNPFKLLNQPKKEIFKALDDVSFNVMPGESIGIIGRNGAGKSTLLKILSKITPPSSGKVICRGRIAALLEVGTGFHPELTGRENVYMNGSILGMRKWEIDKHFDEIIYFSGVEKFLDTPLKRYSSGMQLRLAFAVAAHLEPEILIIDEVLAVGDAEFQKKCLGKMDEVSKSGRTVIFVSHDLSAVSTLTKNALFIENGKTIEYDNTKKVIQTYSGKLSKESYFYPEIKREIPQVSKLEIFTSEGGAIHGCMKKLKINFEITVPFKIEGLGLSIQIMNHLNQPATYNWIFDSNGENFCRKTGINKVEISYPELKLYKGNYFLRVHLAESITKSKFQQFDCLPFEVQMIEMSAPEWGWQENVCQYKEKVIWS